MIDVRATALARSHLGSLRFLVLAVLGILVAHDSVFVLQFGLGAGYEAAMAQTAHGYWPAFILFTLLVTGAAALAAARALSRLGRMVRGLPPAAGRRRPPAYGSEVRRLWPRLLVVVLVGFAVQENIEHYLAGGGWPGLWVLSAPDYPLAIPAIVTVSGLLAAVGGWVQWRRDTLIERLRAARAGALRRRRNTDRTPNRRWALLAALLANRWALMRRDAERAPPAGSAA